MIIDNHVHIFPDQAGPAGYKDGVTYARELQKMVVGHWGRMVTSHTDPKYVPEPDENLGFHVGKFARYHWKKHGEDVWLQRGPVTLETLGA